MKKGYKPKYTPYYFQLEKRIVFDGAAAEAVIDTVAVAADAASAESVQDAIQESIANDTEANKLEEAVQSLLQTTPAVDDQETTSITSVLFVDSAVQDYETLTRGVDESTAVVILSRNQDGVQQIADALGSYSNLQSIQVVSHGSEGQVSLGNTTLNNSTIDTYTEALEEWGDSLSKDGDILLYGCNVAADEGRSFINRLSDITSADIAASTDDTGSAALGGDWDLESSAGSVEAESSLSSTAVDDYDYLLADLLVYKSWDTHSYGGSAVDFRDSRLDYAFSGGNITVTTSNNFDGYTLTDYDAVLVEFRKHTSNHNALQSPHSFVKNFGSGYPGR